MKCPKCRSETLLEFKIEAVAVDRCSSCNGIWFDAQELSQVLSEDAKLVASLRTGAGIAQLNGKKGICPRDDSELLRVYSSVERSVILDACGECGGVWLDGGEFQKLYAAPRP
jgi:Zn-finger nucleic acid-binding protein